MAERATDLKLDPVVVPIGDIPEPGAFDEWLAGLVRGEHPTVLSKPAAEFVAEVRAEAE